MTRLSTFLIAFLLISNRAWTQLAKQANRFMTDFVATEPLKLPLYYREELPKHNLGDIIKALASTKIYGFNYKDDSGPFNDSLTLTEKERSFLQQQFNQQSGKIWTKPHFRNWHLVSEDSLKHYHEVDQYFWFSPDRLGGRLYTFSKPVFFRNDSMCLFYWGYWCGTRCGEGQLALYQKQDGKWKYRFSLFMWES
ncbi:hypothetical protein [Paracnuella aquatica]|uniref:hypothetical protein n=1 Tax=Paracnuella aquatica TaxID=2268757 RepID=UPI000DEFFFBD|nr:hypothetical protein [Paracnuella aquatica]RPD45185.1 hypothetical protein DRJ53_16240 [Paracnuella aquatica]